jgi:predicted CopG family antitoxin
MPKENIMTDNQDIVSLWIELKKQSKEVDEKLKALETLILAEYRDDERIKVVAGRKTITITDEAYSRLSEMGIETEVTEVRKKKLEEFDIDIQKVLLNNPKNYAEKSTKESLRIK